MRVRMNLQIPLCRLCKAGAVGWLSESSLRTPSREIMHGCRNQETWKNGLKGTRGSIKGEKEENSVHKCKYDSHADHIRLLILRTGCEMTDLSEIAQCYMLWLKNCGRRDVSENFHDIQAAYYPAGWWRYFSSAPETLFVCTRVHTRTCTCS